LRAGLAHDALHTRLAARPCAAFRAFEAGGTLHTRLAACAGCTLGASASGGSLCTCFTWYARLATETLCASLAGAPLRTFVTLDALHARLAAQARTTLGSLVAGDTLYTRLSTRAGETRRAGSAFRADRAGGALHFVLEPALDQLAGVVVQDDRH
jgi:hypothetical protein